MPFFAAGGAAPGGSRPLARADTGPRPPVPVLPRERCAAQPRARRPALGKGTGTDGGGGVLAPSLLE